MHHTRLRSLLTASALALAALGAAAQSTPKIKPGLWEIHMEQEKNGQKMPDASERMKERRKNMSPEERKQFDEMMKQRGVDPEAGSAINLCYTPKMVEQGAWTNQGGGCKTDYSRNATSWKWHSVCPALSYEGNGEASFPDPDNFIVKSSGVSTAGGKTVTVNSTRTGKWLSGDCGNVKPMDGTVNSR